MNCVFSIEVVLVEHLFICIHYMKKFLFFTAFIFKNTTMATRENPIKEEVDFIFINFVIFNNSASLRR